MVQTCSSCRPDAGITECTREGPPESPRGLFTRGRGSHTQAQCRTRARVRFKRGTLGTRPSEVVVENSLALASTRGPSGRDDLSRKAGAISSRPRRAGYVRGKAPHQRAMKRYEQPIMMAPRANAGLIGKAQAPNIERRGYPVNP